METYAKLFISVQPDQQKTKAKSDASTLVPLTLFNAPIEFLAGLSPLPEQKEQQLDEAPTQSDSETQRPALGHFSCASCGGLVFPDSRSQREHFKLPYHVENVRRRVQKIGRPLREEEYELWLAGIWEESDEDEVYVTCSEGEGDTDTSDDESLSDEASTSEGSECISSTTKKAISKGGTPMFWMQHSDYPGHYIGLYKHVVFENMSRPRGAELDLEKELKQLLMMRENPRYWTVIMYTTGHFAGVVLDTKTNTVVVHKTLHKYVVRKKRGFSQVAHDKKTGGKARSVGARLRRENAHALDMQVANLLASWKEHLDKSDRIFIRSSIYHRAAIYAEAGPIKYGDPRVRSIPFITKRPTYGEALHVLEVLSRFNAEPVNAHPPPP